MDKNRWHEIEEIVDQALSIDSIKERTAFLSNRLTDDEELRREVTSLLDSIEASQGLWEELLASNEKLVADMTHNNEQSLPTVLSSLPDQIGPYRIKQLLGRGGMGDVYLAERIDSDFHQNVALKVLQREVQNQEANQRFIQERKILSTLNHPNIAGLLDGGISEGGRPYFVMEYVDGLPITEYCRKNDCNLHQRLDLFIQACEAVQYAHRNFIVHRDLKPANLLVTDKGILKVLDFGIAKLLDRELSEEQLLQTKAGNRLLSLSFAAPEQITGEPVTAATDVYALGLLLYELLTGTPAFDLKGKKLIDAERIIRYKDPAKPSTITERWQKRIKGDLDAIVLKALRKEPEQRYESASRILEDIERNRSIQPVQARRGTYGYRTGKFFRRNKPVIIAAFLLINALVGFAGYHFVQINEARKIAELETDKAQQVSEFLIGIFQNADPWLEPDNNELTVKGLLDQGATYIQNEIQKQPELKASLLSSLGEIYRSIGNFKKAEPLLAEAITIEKKLLAGRNGSEKDLALYYHRMGRFYKSTGDFKTATKLFSNATQIFEKLNQEKDLASLTLDWAWAEFELANFEKADSLISIANRIHLKYFGRNSLEYANVFKHSAWLEFDRGKYHKADSLMSLALDIHKSHPLRNHPVIAQTMHSLAWMKLHLDTESYEEAYSYNKEALLIKLRIFEKPHFEIAITMNTLGAIYLKMGELKKAEEHFLEAIEMHRATLPANHPYAIKTLGNIGSLHLKKGEYEMAEKIFRKIVNNQRIQLTENHPNRIYYLYKLADALHALGQYGETLILLKEALEIQKKNFADKHPYALKIRDSMAEAYESIKQYNEAEKLRLQNLEISRKDNGSNHKKTKAAIKSIVNLYEKMGLVDYKKEYMKILSEMND